MINASYNAMRASDWTETMRDLVALSASMTADTQSLLVEISALNQELRQLAASLYLRRRHRDRLPRGEERRLLAAGRQAVWAVR
jgi:hypothetical protein